MGKTIKKTTDRIDRKARLANRRTATAKHTTTRAQRSASEYREPVTVDALAMRFPNAATARYASDWN